MNLFHLETQLIHDLYSNRV